MDLKRRQMDLIRSRMNLKRLLLRAHGEKKTEPIFLKKEAILIPFMVRIQANFRKWPTIVII